jgi:hypothetical protein
MGAVAVVGGVFAGDTAPNTLLHPVPRVFDVEAGDGGVR